MVSENCCDIVFSFAAASTVVKACQQIFELTLVHYVHHYEPHLEYMQKVFAGRCGFFRTYLSWSKPGAPTQRSMRLR